MLPINIFDKVEVLSLTGNEYFDEEKYEEAIQSWSTALDLLPPPVVSWDAFEWLFASIGDARYLQKKYTEALHALLDAYGYDTIDPNPFVLYRIGQCYEKTKNLEKTTDFLLQANMLDGSDIFEADDKEGVYYLNFLKTSILIN